MTYSLFLLAAITFLYAGYNLFVKVSTNHVPAATTSTVLATICLQVSALAVSLLFMGFLLARGGEVMQLSRPAYLWAALAGLSIGIAEVAYFYLFKGVGGESGMAANVAVPVIVSGTVVITAVVAYVFLQESFNSRQLGGAALVVCGLAAIVLGTTGD